MQPGGNGGGGGGGDDEIDDPALETAISLIEGVTDVFRTALQFAGVSDTPLLDQVDELAGLVSELRVILTTDITDIESALSVIDSIEGVITTIEERADELELDTPVLDGLIAVGDQLTIVRQILALL